MNKIKIELNILEISIIMSGLGDAQQQAFGEYHDNLEKLMGKKLMGKFYKMRRVLSLRDEADKLEQELLSNEQNT